MTVISVAMQAAIISSITQAEVHATFHLYGLVSGIPKTFCHLYVFFSLARPLFYLLRFWPTVVALIT